jgi:hypothetical protein
MTRRSKEVLECRPVARQRQATIRKQPQTSCVYYVVLAQMLAGMLMESVDWNQAVAGE